MGKLAMILLPVFMVLTSAAASANNCLLIDDFTSGQVRSSLRTPNTSDTKTQTGSMLGGVRGTLFLINTNSFLQPAEMDVDKPNNNGVPLVVTTGLRTGFRLDMEYGVDTNFVTKPLGYFPTGCDRFRVHFDSASQVLNFNILVFQQNGFQHHFQDGINLDPSPFTNPFCVDFLFANFAGGLPNDTEDFAGQGIAVIDFIFQTGSAIGGNEFAVTRIETLDSTTAGANPCAIVAPPLGS